ncbi:MAG: PorV/PorQ family protein [Candidatus Cloacimonetes bacterium]|nr:PorV/PorQ family protein [Candidatus Cloacimonadota bacterium]
MKFFKKSVIIIAILTISVNLFSSIDKNAGKYGYQFLKMPVAVELAGTANTGEMFSDSPLIMMHNPVAYNRVFGSMVAISHTSWMIDTNMYNIAWRKTNFNNSFGFGLIYVDYGEFENRTDNGLLVGSYYPMDLNFTVNYSQLITDGFYAGLNLKLLYEKLNTSSALALTSDLGFLYKTPLKFTNFDFNIKNLINISGKMDNEAIDLPLIAEFGITSGKEITENIRLAPALKLVYMQDYEDIKPFVGLNTVLYDMFTIRFGYKFNYNEEDFSTGVGFKINNIELNYSFVNNLDNVHLIGLNWKY